ALAFGEPFQIPRERQAFLVVVKKRRRFRLGGAVSAQEFVLFVQRWPTKREYVRHVIQLNSGARSLSFTRTKKAGAFRAAGHNPTLAPAPAGPRSRGLRIAGAPSQEVHSCGTPCVPFFWDCSLPPRSRPAALRKETAPPARSGTRARSVRHARCRRWGGGRVRSSARSIRAARRRRHAQRKSPLPNPATTKRVVLDRSRMAGRFPAAIRVSCRSPSTTAGSTS